jgi:hypothetical protein
MIVLGRGFWLQNAPVEHLVGFSRYHYAALIPLTIAFCIVFAQFDRSAWFGARAGNVLLLAWLVCCGAAYLYQPLAIDHHAEARRQTSEAVEAIRKQIQAQPQGAAVFIRNRHFRPLPLPAVHFPGTAAAFVIFFPGNVVDGRPVYFVDRNPTVRAAFKGKRTTTLIVPPGSE